MNLVYTHCFNVKNKMICIFLFLLKFLSTGLGVFLRFSFMTTLIPEA